MTFDQVGDFAAINAALAWCAERGVSVGSMQGDAPMGLLVGDYVISKWRNMNPRERSMLDGSIIGDKRLGPVVLQITQDALDRIAALRSTGAL